MANYKNIKKPLIVFLCFTSTFLFGQVQENSELYKTIISKDSLLFNVGFNTCDISQFENLLSNKLEFLHDKAMLLGISLIKNAVSVNQDKREMNLFFSINH